MHEFAAHRRVVGCCVLMAVSLFTGPRATAQRAVTPFVPPLARVDSLVGAEFARDSVGSITAGIVQGDQLIWTASYGFANIGARAAANRQTVYRIGSITKMFTATMLLQLASAGRVHLSDPVVRHLPELAGVRGASSRQPATLLQLATMTSGLAAEPSEAGVFDTGAVTQWEATLQRAMRKTTFTAQAGTHYQYSNIGYAILGAALGRAARVPYITWQEQRIFKPLGMRRTHFGIPSDLRQDLAVGYVVTDGVADSATPMREVTQGRGYRVPNGGIFTTIDDLSRFMAFELGHGPEAVLPRAQLDSVYAGVVATSADEDFGYGVGFMLQRRGDFPWLGHSGGVPGYQAVLYFDRDHQLGVILLRSATGGRASINRLGPDLLKMLILEKIAAERSRR